MALRLLVTVPAYAATPEPTNTPAAPPTATHATATTIPSATPTYHTATPRPTQTSIPTPFPTQYFWGASEATSVASGASPLAIASPRATRTPAPTRVAGASGAQPLFGSAWVSPEQENEEAVRLTVVEARLHPTVTPTLHTAGITELASGPSQNLTPDQLNYSVPPRMKLAGPVDVAAGSNTTQGRVSAAGLPLPPPIRYAGIPSQSRDAGWVNSTVLWLSVPHRTQFDGTLYAGTNCGPAALGMILEAFGLKGYPTDAIRGEVNRFQGDSNPDNGTSLYAIAAVAQRAGLYPTGLSKRWSIADVRATLAQGLPIITLTRYADLPGNGGSDPGTNHYIVLSGLAGDQIIYNDPAYSQGAGRGLLIPPETLMRAWANSDVPGQAVAFAVDANGAGLMSPLAIQMHQAFLDDEGLDDDEDADIDDEYADIDDSAGWWRFAVRSIGNNPVNDARLTSLSVEQPVESLGSGPGPVAPSAPPVPWPVLALVVIAVLLSWTTLTFAFVRVAPAARE